MPDIAYSFKPRPRFFRNAPRRKPSPLNIHDPRVLELSDRFNLSPKTVAYLRAALGSGRYTKESLIRHIQEENEIRSRAIEDHRATMAEDPEGKTKLIEYTEINIHFREGVVEKLHGLGEIQLNEICS